MTDDGSRRCWKGHIREKGEGLTGVVKFGEMLWTCHEHYKELRDLPEEADYSQRRDN